MNFPQFAFNNVRRNSRAYFAFFFKQCFYGHDLFLLFSLYLPP